MPSISELPITIRRAYPDDAHALRLLAALDSSEVPAEPVLVAEVDGELRAAVSISDLEAIADPFFPTADIVELMRGHIAGSVQRPRRRRRLRGAPALVPAH